MKRVALTVAILPACVIALVLAGCATPVTYLKNPKTGEVVSCGGGVVGSWVGGLAGFGIEERHDNECVANHAAAGLIPFYPGYDQPTAHNRR
jgi:hypothetical protein